MSRYLPEPTKISKPFWDSCNAGAMQIQRCADCGTYAFYPVFICPECASRQLEWTPVSGRGSIHTYTVAAQSVFEGVEGPVVVALVELEEGAMMTTNIKTDDPYGVHIGMAVKLAYEPISEDITLPVFEVAS
ncbi:Zn-ribbon domain-containing OB-fold protein [uncultured Jannaschia sp.]|uniref:Zn-ribbon domain-containing OB-fold protein n=1 Tax=uncultured Jannaschia sp. TaxID=293347 RepID=UPI00262D3191|nr:Zn-ribbon domain-containing OB-fold protein [uncultured Jannaschia sp.]